MKARYTKEQFASNIWKYFIYNVSVRRHFIPILALYFLTLPDTNATQIGIYTGVGYIFSFLFEIPSGYVADRFGHKQTLIVAKILMILSVTSFIIANSLFMFVIGSILLAVGFGFHSGTGSAFMHETLIQIGKEEEYTKIMSKQAANVSLVSALLAGSLPFFTTISMVVPLQINLVFDVIGLIAAISLRSPPQKLAICQTLKGIFSSIKRAAKPGFYSVSLFLGILGGFLFGISAFRVPYLEELGLPIIFAGLIMFISRILWFVVGHNAHTLEKKIGVKKLLEFDVIVFPVLFFLTVFFTNPYIIVTIFSIITAYYWGRNQIVINHFLRYLITDQRYKATMLSVNNQVQLIVQVIVAFGVGFVMNVSYRLGFLVTAISLFVALLVFMRGLKYVE